MKLLPPLFLSTEMFTSFKAGAMVLALALVGCGPSGSSDTAGTEDLTKRNPIEGSADNVVEITARGLVLEGPHEIPSGWTTFRLKNESAMVHFAILERMPARKGIKDHKEEVVTVFQNFMDNFNNKPLSEPDAGLELPEWFSEVVFMSGPGFISPNKTAETIVHLQPGNYLLECYVKTNGVFHSYNSSPDMYGMVHEMTVTEVSSGNLAPKPTLEIDISSEQGIEVRGSATSGEHVVAVHFKDQKIYEHFVGHDVHLVQVNEDTDLQQLSEWMDWTKPGGLETPAPAEFLGGTHEMAEGETGYFRVVLERGTYAWIAEVPDPTGKSMLKTFTIPSAMASER